MSSYVKLDDVIKSFCSELGDSGLGMYPTYYQYIYNWLEEVKDQRLGGVGGDFRMPVDSRRVYFPSNMAIKDVGIVVNGNLQVLLPNGNMLDLADDCGSMEAPSTGNPDYPSYNMGNQLAPTTALLPGTAVNNNGFRLAPISGMFHWPGQGGGKSAVGYYRIFWQKGYILLDDTCPYSEVIVRGALPTFSPGVQTWVLGSAREAIKAFCIYRMVYLQSQVNGDRKSYQGPLADYLRAMRNLRAAINSEPLCAYISAVQSSYGQIGV